MTDFLELFSKQPTREELAAAFDDIEADLTYIDDTEKVIYFSPFRIFNRYPEILDQSVYDCHKPESVPGIKEMLDAFKAGTSHKVSHQAHANGRDVQVCYQAMRDRNGVYLGCLEAVTYR